MKNLSWNIPPTLTSLLSMEKGGKSVGVFKSFLSFSVSSLMALLCQSTQVYEELNVYLVVPDLNQAVICTRDEIGLVPSTVIVNAVYSFLVAFQSKIGWRGAKLPYLPREKTTTQTACSYPSFASKSALPKSRHSDGICNFKDTEYGILFVEDQLPIKLPIFHPKSPEITCQVGCTVLTLPKKKSFFSIPFRGPKTVCKKQICQWN